METTFERPGTPGHLILVSALKAFAADPSSETYGDLGLQLAARKEDHIPEDDRGPVLTLIMEAANSGAKNWEYLPPTVQEFLLTQWSREELEVAFGEAWCFVDFSCPCGKEGCNETLLICRTSAFPDFIAPENRGKYIAHERAKAAKDPQNLFTAFFG